jgi:hypothetical protein
MFSEEWGEIAVNLASFDAQPGNPACVLWSQPKPTQADYELEPDKIDLLVLAIAVCLPSRGGQRSDRFVPADRRWGDPGFRRELGDLHAATVHLQVT